LPLQPTSQKISAGIVKPDKFVNRMKYDPQIHHRRSIRLIGYDYSQPGAYFVTLVTYQRERLFGNIINDEMVLNSSGKIVWEIWSALPKRYPEIGLDEAVVMPDHFHGILWINAPDFTVVGAIHELPLPVCDINLEENQRLRRRRMLLPTVIGYFKMNVAKEINLQLDSPGASVWQRNYYEHIVRDEGELDALRLYIRENPRNWEKDELS
jgi:putative transposase